MVRPTRPFGGVFRACAPGAQAGSRPLSTTTDCPVTYAAAGLSGCTTRATTSSAAPCRPSGTRETMLFTAASVSAWASEGVPAAPRHGVNRGPRRIMGRRAYTRRWRSGPPTSSPSSSAASTTTRCSPSTGWLAGLRGLRRGELCGLRWSDIDLDRGVLTIERDRTTVGHQVVEGDPKTPAGRSAVALDRRSVQILRVHRRYEQDRRAETAENATVGSGMTARLTAAMRAAIVRGRRMELPVGQTDDCRTVAAVHVAARRPNVRSGHASPTGGPALPSLMAARRSRKPQAAASWPNVHL